VHQSGDSTELLLLYRLKLSKFKKKGKRRKREKETNHTGYSPLKVCTKVEAVLLYMVAAGFQKRNSVCNCYFSQLMTPLPTPSPHNGGFIAFA
jgi:hypothetical protein